MLYNIWPKIKEYVLTRKGLVMKKHRIASKGLVLAISALLLGGCSGGGSSTSNTKTSLYVSGDSELIAGSSANVSVSLGTTSLPVAQSAQTATEATNIQLHFASPANAAEDFSVHRSANCDHLTGLNVCHLTITSNNKALGLRNDSISYTVSAQEAGQMIVSPKERFQIKTLYSRISSAESLGYDVLGIGSTGTLTIENRTGMAINLTDYQLSSSAMAFSDNGCTGELGNGAQCQANVTVNEQVKPGTVHYYLKSPQGVEAVDEQVSIIQPVLRLSPTTASLLPFGNKQFTVKNTSDVTATGLNISLPQIQGVSEKSTTCQNGSSLSAGQSCTITLKTNSNPADGSGELKVSSTYAKAVTAKVSASTPQAMSIGLSTPSITTNSGANKQVVVTVANNSHTPLYTLSAVASNSELPGVEANALKVVPFLSSCADFTQNNPLSAGQSCRFVMDYVPGEVSQKQWLDYQITVSAAGSASISKPLQVNAYPMFYTIPQDTQRYLPGPPGIVNQVVVSPVSPETIYAATGGGLAITRDGGESWQNYTTVDGLRSNSISGLVVSNDKIYLATQRGVSIFNTNGSFVKNCPLVPDESKYGGGNARLSVNYVNGIFVTQNTLYAATWAGLVTNNINCSGTWTLYNKDTTPGLKANYISNVIVADDKVYLATRSGLAVASVDNLSGLYNLCQRSDLS